MFILYIVLLQLSNLYVYYNIMNCCSILSMFSLDTLFNFWVLHLIFIYITIFMLFNILITK